MTTRFLYGPGGILLEKQGSTYTATYTIGNALVRKYGEYPLFDGLGSERTVTNSSQSVTGTINYDAFGQTMITRRPLRSRLGESGPSRRGIHVTFCLVARLYQ